MKKMQKVPVMEARTVALLIGLSVGMGLAVHQFFFVVALGVVLLAAAEWTAQKADEYFCDFHMRPRHL